MCSYLHKIFILAKSGCYTEHDEGIVWCARVERRWIGEDVDMDTGGWARLRG
jgi:hypothetical protein